MQETVAQLGASGVNSTKDDGTVKEIGPNARRIQDKLAEEHDHVANSNIVELQSVNVSEHSGMRVDNETLRSSSVSKSQDAVGVSSSIPRHSYSLSFAIENELLANTSLKNASLHPTIERLIGNICTPFRNADNDRRLYQSNSAYDNGGDGTIYSQSVNTSRVERYTVAEHDTSLVGESSLNVYDTGAGILLEERRSQPTYLRNGLNNANYPDEVCCSDEATSMSSARTRPWAGFCSTMPNYQSDASDKLPAHLSSRSLLPSFDEEAGIDGSSGVLLQEERPASADFYKTSGVLSRVYDSVSPTVVSDSGSRQVHI